MEQYIVSARKYRPDTFDTVVGQQAITTTLKNAIANGKLAHAYLFCGPRGVGKTTCARIFAKTINCEHRHENGEACNECESCQSFNEQRSLNIHELDAASNNGVDDIRELTDQVQIPPQIGRYKVFIIDEVHMLSTQAFNAFLKTLEEPPSHAIFILATTEKHKILPTILSRCQIYDFARMGTNTIVEHLKSVAAKENVTYEESALHLIAQKADGGMRDALSIFDQITAFCSGNITYAKAIENLNVLDYDYYFKIVDQFLKADVTGAMLTLNDVLTKGFGADIFINGLSAHLRDLLMSKEPSTLPMLEVSDDVRQRYAEQAQKCSPKFIYRALKLCNDCDMQYRQSLNKRLLVELTLIQVAQLSDTSDDVPGSGLGPTQTILKKIFDFVSAAPVRKVETPAPTKTPQTPAQSAVIPATPVKRPTGTVGRTISIRGRNNAPETGNNVTSPVATTVERDEDFTEEDFNLAWMRYALNLPQEKVADATQMKAMRLTKVGDREMHLVVTNTFVKKSVEDMMRDILKAIGNELHNDKIKITVEVDDTPVAHRAFTSKDILKELSKHESVQMLVEKLQLELT